MRGCRDVIRHGSWPPPAATVDDGLNNNATTMQVEPPPPLSEDRSVVDLTRRRLTKRKRFNVGIPPFAYLKAWRTRRNSNSHPVVEHSTSASGTEIDLSDTCELDLDTSQDIYRWAVVYENQRGFALAPFVSSAKNTHITYFAGSPSFLPHITLAWDYSRMIHHRSPSPKRMADGTGSPMCRSITTRSQMVLGVGCRHPGWLICEAKAKFTTMASSITGFSVVTSGARNRARSAPEGGCGAGDGSAL